MHCITSFKFYEHLHSYCLYLLLKSTCNNLIFNHKNVNLSIKQLCKALIVGINVFKKPSYSYNYNVLGVIHLIYIHFIVNDVCIMFR